MKYEPIENDVMDESQHMLERFLMRHFPISRIKNKKTKRFQRGIVLKGGFIDDGNDKYYLTPYNNAKQLMTQLYNILYGVFGFKRDEILKAIYRYLFLK